MQLKLSIKEIEERIQTWLGFMILPVGKIPRKLIFCVCYMYGNDSSHILSSITFYSLMASSRLQTV